MKLHFSQASQPTPSAQLGAGFKNMSLSSQSAASGTQGDARPPVPLFSEAPPVPVSSQQLPLPPPPLEIPLSQQDCLGTQDFITPVDQFNLEYDPRDAKRSPARLSPNRGKRPRSGGSAGAQRWRRLLCSLKAVALTALQSALKSSRRSRTPPLCTPLLQTPAWRRRAS